MDQRMWQAQQRDFLANIFDEFFIQRRWPDIWISSGASTKLPLLSKTSIHFLYCYDRVCCSVLSLDMRSSMWFETAQLWQARFPPSGWTFTWQLESYNVIGKGFHAHTHTLSWYRRSKRSIMPRHVGLVFHTPDLLGLQPNLPQLDD